MNIKIDLSFPHKYEVRILDSLPPKSQHILEFNFPNKQKTSIGNKLLVKVTSNVGLSWIGIFSEAYKSPIAITGVFSCPNALDVCIISAGGGYLIQTQKPTIYTELPSFPILDTHVIQERGLILFVDFTRIIAYDSKGVAWKTSKLSHDGINITEISKNHVKGTGWSATSNKDVDFILDIETGKPLLR